MKEEPEVQKPILEQIGNIGTMLKKNPAYFRLWNYSEVIKEELLDLNRDAEYLKDEYDKIDIPTSLLDFAKAFRSEPSLIPPAERELNKALDELLEHPILSKHEHQKGEVAFRAAIAPMKTRFNQYLQTASESGKIKKCYTELVTAGEEFYKDPEKSKQDFSAAIKNAENILPKHFEWFQKILDTLVQLGLRNPSAGQIVRHYKESIPKDDLDGGTGSPKL